MADNKEMSNTMELNSILQEAHELRSGSEGRPVSRYTRGAQDYHDPPESDVTAAEAPDNGDGFVFFEDGASDSDRHPRSGNHPDGKSKKPMLIALIIVGAILLAGIVGVIIWKTASPSAEPVVNVAENVIVNGVNVGGMELDDAMAALAPVEAKLADAIRIEVAAGEKKITLSKEDFTYSFNTEEVLKKAQQGNSSDNEIRIIVDDGSYSAAAEKVAAEVDVKAQDAKVTAFNPVKSDMFTIQEGVAGKTLDREDLAKQLKSLFDGGKTSGSVEGKITEAKPAYTAEYLKKNIKKLSSFTTESTNTSNGMSNQALSLSSCNGSVIEPGATWSFNKCTGDSNLESNGYKPAGVIVQGRYETGIGGGICQSSTTIYNAGILSGMEIVERYCHAYPASYVDYGRDATIDYGNLDLKLKNPFKHQLFLKCWMDGVILHAEVYGLPAEDFDEVRVTTTAPAYGANSYTVKASRSYYKDGKLVRTEALPSSTYSNYSSSSDSTTPSTAPTTAPSVTPTTPGVNPTAPDNPSVDPEPTSDPEPDPEPTPDPEPDPEPTPDPDPREESGEDPAETPEG